MPGFMGHSDLQIAIVGDSEQENLALAKQLAPTHTGYAQTPLRFPETFFANNSIFKVYPHNNKNFLNMALCFSRELQAIIINIDVSNIQKIENQTKIKIPKNILAEKDKEYTFAEYALYLRNEYLKEHLNQKPYIYIPIIFNGANFSNNLTEEKKATIKDFLNNLQNEFNQRCEDDCERDIAIAKDQKPCLMEIAKGNPEPGFESIITAIENIPTMIEEQKKSSLDPKRNSLEILLKQAEKESKTQEELSKNKKYQIKKATQTVKKAVRENSFWHSPGKVLATPFNAIGRYAKKHPWRFSAFVLLIAAGLAVGAAAGALAVFTGGLVPLAGATFAGLDIVLKYAIAGTVGASVGLTIGTCVATVLVGLSHLLIRTNTKASASAPATSVTSKTPTSSAEGPTSSTGILKELGSTNQTATVHQEATEKNGPKPSVQSEQSATDDQSAGVTQVSLDAETIQVKDEDTVQRPGVGMSLS